MRPESTNLINPLARIALVSASVLVVDQLSKSAVLRFLDYGEQRIIADGFFKLVHWGNTGAAWSLFYGNNKILALVSILALIALVVVHPHFNSHRPEGQAALGMVCGGIVGNLVDRIRIGHVVDFVRFYVESRSGAEVGFPAFNVADMGICFGVAIVFWMSLFGEPGPTGAIGRNIGTS